MIKKTIKRGKTWFNANTDKSLEQLQREAYLIKQSQAVIIQRQNDIDGRMVNSGSILLSDKEMVAKIFSGLKIYLDPRDISVTPHLALDTIWEPDITKAWLSVLRPDDTVMDIGANFGYFGLIAAQQVNRKKAKVIFFEANPGLIGYIRKSLAVNWLNQQSVLENMAVSDKKGKLTLNIMKDYMGSSSILSSDELNDFMSDKMYVETEKRVEVAAESIDSYCEKNNIKAVNLIKMDIEGYEDKAYQGMRNTVKNSLNLSLFIEFTKDSYENPEKFYAQLMEDFGHVYLIDNAGKIKKPAKADYKTIVGSSEEWVMPIFSKRKDLAAT